MTNVSRKLSEFAFEKIDTDYVRGPVDDRRAYHLAAHPINMYPFVAMAARVAELDDDEITGAELSVPVHDMVAPYRTLKVHNEHPILFRREMKQNFDGVAEVETTVIFAEQVQGRVPQRVFDISYSGILATIAKMVDGKIVQPHILPDSPHIRTDVIVAGADVLHQLLLSERDQIDTNLCLFLEGYPDFLAVLLSPEFVLDEEHYTFLRDRLACIPQIAGEFYTDQLDKFQDHCGLAFTKAVTEDMITRIQNSWDPQRGYDGKAWDWLNNPTDMLARLQSAYIAGIGSRPPH